MLRVNLASQNLFLSQFHDLSSMRADSKYRTWTWSQLFSPKPPGGQYDNFEQYFWQIFAPILAWGIKRRCFDNLEMRHSFMDLLKIVSFFIWHDSPVQCDLQYWFFPSKLQTHHSRCTKKCMMSSLMLVVSAKSRVQRNFDGFDRLCSKVVATRSARKQN